MAGDGGQIEMSASEASVREAALPWENARPATAKTTIRSLMNDLEDPLLYPGNLHCCKKVALFPLLSKTREKYVHPPHPKQCSEHQFHCELNLLDVVFRFGLPKFG